MASSSVHFFRRMCDLLAGRGIHRHPGSTPLEFAGTAFSHFPAADDRAHQAMLTIVHHFYRQRFGGREVITPDEEASISGSLDQIATLVHRAETGSIRGVSEE